MFESVLNYDTDSNSHMQIESIAILESIFHGKIIRNLVIENYYFEGFSGTYEGRENYTLYFTFEYHGFKFEFYLSYDQLEFYISNDSKTLKKFIMEDTAEEHKMLTIFRECLINNINQLTLKQISSKFKPVYRKVFAAFCIVAVLIMAYFSFIEKSENFWPLPILALLIFGSIAYFTKRDVIYIDKNDFVVKDQRILIKDMISIQKKIGIPVYEVQYYDENDTIKSFKLEVDQFLSIKPDFIKKLEALVATNTHITRNIL